MTPEEIAQSDPRHYMSARDICDKLVVSRGYIQKLLTEQEEGKPKFEDVLRVGSGSERWQEYRIPVASIKATFDGVEDPHEQHMKIRQIMERLAVSRSFVSKLLNQGKLRGFRLPHTKAGWRIAESAVKEFEQSSKVA